MHTTVNIKTCHGLCCGRQDVGKQRNEIREATLFKTAQSSDVMTQQRTEENTRE